MVSQPVRLGVKPHLGHKTKFLYCVTVPALLMWDILFDERTGLSFVMTIAVHDVCIYNLTCTELLGLFWTLSIVLYVEDKKSHNVSETGSVSETL
jgi:hypothetical protein